MKLREPFVFYLPNQIWISDLSWTKKVCLVKKIIIFHPISKRIKTCWVKIVQSSMRIYKW